MNIEQCDKRADDWVHQENAELRQLLRLHRDALQHIAAAMDANAKHGHSLAAARALVGRFIEGDS